MRSKQLLLCVLTLALLTLPVSAHGHGRHGGCHGRAAVQTAAVCSVENCEAAGRHVHHGVTYCGYDHAGGFCDNSCRALCAVEGCDIPGRHVHDGVTYCGYDHAGGFCDNSCRALCAVEGCDIPGRHVHDGTTYCGDHHESGFCEGSCHTTCH